MYLLIAIYHISYQICFIYDVCVK